MKAVVIYCHPDPESFTAAVKQTVCAKLQSAGAETRVLDLYDLDFQPVLTQGAWRAYEDESRNCEGVEAHVETVRWADTMIFVYPTWWYGMPAMLKGWLDRVLVPGVAFHMPQGEDIRPALHNITRLGVFTTGGASRWLTAFIGAPGRRTLMRGVRLLCAPKVRLSFAMHYDMDDSTPATRERHLRKVARAMDRLVRPQSGERA
ncbi:MAG: NAD(P)H-dependent oxidoreductase [Pseudomonadota bacterium]